MRSGRACTSLFFAVAVTAVGIGCDAPASPPAGVRIPLGVYAEFLPYADVTPHLSALAARDATLTVAVPDARIGDADLAALLRAAEAEGVEIRLWLVLDRSEGYWPNETNVPAYDAAVVRLLAWLAADGLTASTIVFDLEPALAYSEELRGVFSTADLTAITTLLRTHIDATAFAAAEAALTATVLRVQAAGLRAECVTYPQVIDDGGDDDLDLEDALDIPVSGVPWDEVSFMVYQTGFSEAAPSGEWLGPSLVRSYAEDARSRFGDRATIALGLVGRAGIFPPTGPVYELPEVLEADVAAALAEDIARVEVYSLDGMLLLGGPTAWLEATITMPDRPAFFTSDVRLARSLAAALDTQLDAP